MTTYFVRFYGDEDFAMEFKADSPRAAWKRAARECGLLIQGRTDGYITRGEFVLSDEDGHSWGPCPVQSE